MRNNIMKRALIKPLLSLSVGLGVLTVTVSCAVLASSNSFTVQGELPAHTGITFLATYYPEDDQSSACTYRDLASGSSELSGGTVGTEVPIKAEAQHYQVSIPTQTYIKRCKVLLTGVSVEVANESNNDRQTDKTGFIGIVDKTPLPTTAMHPAHFTMSCDWSFKFGSRPSQPDSNIFRLMSCNIAKNKNVSRNIALDDLTDMIFVLDIRILDKQEPYYKDTWVKVKNGWKPCENKENPKADGFCTKPPKFRTFKYQGKTCSVYPSCNEEKE